MTSGTLLGFIRDGSVIPHDDDIDIAVVSSLDVKDLRTLKQHFIKTLRDSGWNVIVPPGNVNLRVGKKAISLDLFLGWFESNGQVSVSPLNRSVFEAEDIFPIRWLDFPLGCIPVPNNYEKLLDVNYGGNWRQPDPSWTFDWKRAFDEYAELKG